jgi:hypothetical protein
MPDNIDRYIPEFDEDESRDKLAGFNREDLTDLLLRAYKEKRLLAKELDEVHKKLERIEAITQEPSALLNMPGVPGPDDLKRMTEDE